MLEDFSAARGLVNAVGEEPRVTLARWPTKRSSEGSRPSSPSSRPRSSTWPWWALAW